MTQAANDSRITAKWADTRPGFVVAGAVIVVLILFGML